MQFYITGWQLLISSVVCVGGVGFGWGVAYSQLVRKKELYKVGGEQIYRTQDDCEGNMITCNKDVCKALDEIKDSQKEMRKDKKKSDSTLVDVRLFLAELKGEKKEADKRRDKAGADNVL